MRAVTQYIAEDGEIFDDKNECIKYEHSQIISNIYVKIFDQSFKELILEDDFEKVANQAWYLNFNDSESKRQFEKLAEYYGICTDNFFDCGLSLYWDIVESDWKDLRCKVDSMKDYIKKCEESGLLK